MLYFINNVLIGGILMSFSLKKVSVGAPFFLIAGPCVIQTEGLCLEIAETIKNIGNELNQSNPLKL